MRGMAKTERHAKGVTRYNESGTNALGKELNRDLIGSRKYPIFDMMSTDAQVSGLFEMLRSTIEGATWQIEGGTPEQNEFVAKWFAHNQNDFLRAACLYLQYGSYAFEQVWMPIVTNIGGRERIAIVDDVQPRQPHTFIRYTRDKSNKLASIEQSSVNGLGTLTPESMVFLVNDSEMMQNLEGVSLYRGAYAGWKLKNEHRLQDIFGAQRWANGTLDINMASNATKPDFDAANELGRRFGSGANTFIVRGKQNNIAEIGVLQATGQPYNAEIKVDSFNKEIAQAMLAQFMTFQAGSLGGAAELVRELVERFYAFVNSKAQYMAGIFTQQRAHRLTRMNFLDADAANMPTVTVSGINKVSAEQAGAFIAQLSTILPAGFFNAADWSILKRYAGLTDFEAAGTTGGEPKTEMRQGKPAACGCGKPHGLAQGKPKAERRALTALETLVEFEAITADLDEGREDLRKRLMETLNRAGATYIAWALPIIEKGDAAEIRKIKARYIPELKTAMLGIVNRLIERGAVDVYAEYKKQTGDTIRKRAVQFDSGLNRLTKQRQAAIKALIEQRAENIANAAADAITTTGLTLIGNLAVDPEDIAGALVQAYGQRAAALINDLAATLPPTAYQVGRADAAAELEVKKTFYSAVMDSNTCDNCAEVDGAEVLDGLPAAPNPQCDGASRCRCIHVFEF
jgi:truncated hemoglobin YjbI